VGPAGTGEVLARVRHASARLARASQKAEDAACGAAGGHAVKACAGKVATVVATRVGRQSRGTHERFVLSESAVASAKEARRSAMVCMCGLRLRLYEHELVATTCAGSERSGVPGRAWRLAMPPWHACVDYSGVWTMDSIQWRARGSLSCTCLPSCCLHKRPSRRCEGV
jgi:hypothetical protein